MSDFMELDFDFSQGPGLDEPTPSGLGRDFGVLSLHVYSGTYFTPGGGGFPVPGVTNTKTGEPVKVFLDGFATSGGRQPGKLFVPRMKKKLYRREGDSLIQDGYLTDVRAYSSLNSGSQLLTVYASTVEAEKAIANFDATIAEVTDDNARRNLVRDKLKILSLEQVERYPRYVLSQEQKIELGIGLDKPDPDKIYKTRIHIWGNVAYPAMFTLDGCLSNVKTGQPMYVSAENGFSNERYIHSTKLDKDGNPQLINKPYWYDFVVYKTVEEMEQAEAEYQNDRSVASDHYPAENWAYGERSSVIAEMLQFGAGDFAKGHPPIKVANTYFLVTKDGTAALDKAGKPVDVKAILREMVAKIDEGEPGQKEGILNQINELSY